MSQTKTNYVSPSTNIKFEKVIDKKGEIRWESTIVYFPVPIGTTSLRELTLVPLFWPRNGVGLRTVLELAVAAISVDAMTTKLSVVLVES